MLAYVLEDVYNRVIAASAGHILAVIGTIHGVEQLGLRAKSPNRGVELVGVHVVFDVFIAHGVGERLRRHLSAAIDTVEVAAGLVVTRGVVRRDSARGQVRVLGALLRLGGRRSLL